LGGDDALDAHDFRGVVEVDGAGGPVEEDGKFFCGEKRHEGGVGGDGRGEHETDGIAGKRGKTLGHEARAGEHAGVGDDAGKIVRRGGFIGVREALADEGLQDVRAFYRIGGVRIGARSVPDFRDSDGRTGGGGDKALRESGEFANICGDEVAAESESLLDGLREVHAVEAVEAEVFKQGGELLFVGGERALEFFLKDFEDGLLRGGSDFFERDVDPHFGLGEVESAGSEQEMVRDEDGLGGESLIVPSLDEGIEFFAGEAGEQFGIDDFDGDFDPAARGEENEVGGKDAERFDEFFAKAGLLAGGRVGGHAAPDADGADEDDGGVGALGEDVGDGAGEADLLEAVALNAAGGIDEKFVALVEACDDALDERLDLLAGAVAVPNHVGDFKGVDEAHKRIEERRPVHEIDDERAQRNVGTELGHDENGIDVAGMIGQDEGGSADLAEFVEAVDLDAVAKPGERAGEIADEELNEHRAVAIGVSTCISYLLMVIVKVRTNIS